MRLLVRFIALTLLAAGSGICLAQPGSPEPPGTLVDAGGHRIHILCAGSGSPAVILEPTMGGFSLDWALVQQSLSQKVRVCSWDRAGSAWSEMALQFGDFDGETTDLSLALSNAGVPPPYVLVGHAYGALAVRNFQRLHPADVAGMVMIDSLSERDGALRAAENGFAVPLLDMSETNLRESLAAYPVAEFTPPSKPAVQSLKRLPPDLQTARAWAEEKWNATVRKLSQAQWLVILESARATYAELYKSRLGIGKDGSGFPLGKLPLALITPAGDDGVERDAAFARLSQNGLHVLANGTSYPTPLEQPGLVVETILKVAAIAQSH